MRKPKPQTSDSDIDEALFAAAAIAAVLTLGGLVVVYSLKAIITGCPI